MRKISLIVLSLVTTILSAALGSPATHAACGSSFYVGSNAEVVSACAGMPESSQIPGFSIDLDNNKITLNDYNGGAIYYFCRATCADIKSMEIELIGDNTISSESSSSYLQENGVPQGAAFINIIPNFTGSGTLEINAAVPFGFENPNSAAFSFDIIGKDFVKVSTQTSETAEVEDIKEELATPAIVEIKGEPSFFNTTAGMVLLIAVPSILVIIIMVLIVALMKKSKALQPSEQKDVNNVPNQTI